MEFKIGGKITLKDDESYLIVDIVEENQTKYYFCSTMKKPISPKVFEKEEKDGKTFVRLVEDNDLIAKIANKVIEKAQNE